MSLQLVETALIISAELLAVKLSSWIVKSISYVCEHTDVC